MRVFASRLWTLVVFATLVGGVPAAAAPVRMLAPVDGAVVSAPEVLLVYVVRAGEQTVVQKDGRPLQARTAPVPGDREDLYHVWLPLDEGRQTFRVLRASDETELLRLAVTYAPPYSLRTAASPGDRPYRFHQKDRESACSGCHSLPEVFETVPDKPLTPAGKVCGACHPRIEQGPHLHGPTAVYACFVCHRPEYAPARFAVNRSQPSNCGTCHEDFLARTLGGNKYVHGPVAAGMCLVCHDPHGGYGSAALRERLPGLCLRCHSETLPLPVNQGLHGKVPCTRCHDPHGGATQELTSARGNRFCAGCHPDVVGAEAGHPIVGHPVEGPVDPSHPGAPYGCTSCHSPHALDDIARMDIVHNEALQRRFCRKCHY